jgi:hypothetical protein
MTVTRNGTICHSTSVAYTNTEMSWINSNVAAEDGCTILSRIARYDLGAYLAVHKYNYFKHRGNQAISEKEYRQITADIQESHHPVLNRSATSVFTGFTKKIRIPFAYVYHTTGTWIKFFVLACMADPEYQRELRCALGRTPAFIARPTTWVLTGLWIYSHAAMSFSTTTEKTLQTSQVQSREAWSRRRKIASSSAATEIRRPRSFIQQKPTASS